MLETTVFRQLLGKLFKVLNKDYNIIHYSRRVDFLDFTPLFNPIFSLSERFSLTAPHRTGLADFPHPALQQNIRSVSTCQVNLRPLNRVYSQNFLEFFPSKPTGLVSSSLRSEKLPFHIAIEFL